jgi:hypothetical protein
MSDQAQNVSGGNVVADADRAVERGEVVEPANGREAQEPQRQEFIEQPAKVMRVGTMLKQLLDEVRSASLDEASRDRLRDIYETSVRELGEALSPDLRDELGRLALPFSDDDSTPPSAAELQIAQAQLVGWLEGLIQGIQATLFAQQMQAQQQLANMRGQLPPGMRPGGAPESDGTERRPGNYL